MVTPCRDIEKLRKIQTVVEKICHNVLVQHQHFRQKIINLELGLRPMERRLTRWGYVVHIDSLSEQEYAQVKGELTVTPFKPPAYAKVFRPKPILAYSETEHHLIVPKSYGLQRWGQPEINNFNRSYPVYQARYLKRLYDFQQVIVDKVIAGFETYGGGLIVAGCGTGKTNMALYIACHVGLPTLCIVHKGDLGQQITDRIIETTNQTYIGCIQGRKVDVDAFFVVATVQSLMMNDYDASVFKNFGLIIIDEVHHMSSPCFSKVLKKLSVKYMLGITAEDSRQDKTFKIINWFFGPILHFEPQRPNDAVVVKRYFYYTRNKKRVQTVRLRCIDDYDRSTMLTNLVRIRQRNVFIAELTKHLHTIGRQTMCLTDRLVQIKVLKRHLKRLGVRREDIGIYVGGMTQEAMDAAKKCAIILATSHMGKEGLDIGTLNAIIFTTPLTTVRQPIGRIIRRDEFVIKPLVIDIIDAGHELYLKQAENRYRYYHNLEYQIQDYYVADYAKGKKYSLTTDLKFVHRSLSIDATCSQSKPKTKPKPKPKILYQAYTQDELDHIAFRSD